MTYQHIVVAVDLTETSREVLAATRDLARQLSASVAVVHAITESALSDMRADLPAESAFDDSIVTRLEAELVDLTASAFGEDRVRIHVILGEETPVVRSILEEERADLLVIGIRNRSRVGKLIMGSNAQELLLGSPCPVLGVPV